MSTAEWKTAAHGTLEAGGRKYQIARLRALEDCAGAPVARLPYSIRILAENLLRQAIAGRGGFEEALALARWRPQPEPLEIPLLPARVLMQDFTGVPAVVDLVAMRSAARERGADPRRVNPVVPTDLVIDHSVQTDFAGVREALDRNMALEFERNHERYVLLRWAQRAFDNFRVVPPATGIVHQVNLEYLAGAAAESAQAVPGAISRTGGIFGSEAASPRPGAGAPSCGRGCPSLPWAFPDSLVGTDSHTTMINGLGVLGWGVGGIEAEAVMLGEPYYFMAPEVLGVRLLGELPAGATPTDAVLMLTQRLRQKGVVGKFVEYFGPGASRLSVEDRALIANMAPEYGATMGFFPVDSRTLAYLRFTGRPAAQIELVEKYCKEQLLFREDSSAGPEYSDVLEFDLSAVEPSVAGPKRPHDRTPLRELKAAFQKALRAPVKERGFEIKEERLAARAACGPDTLAHGAAVIASITSCTNTSNPTVMIAAGLLAKKAAERGLRVRPYVKASLAPGSKVVTDYLTRAGLLAPLESLGFFNAGYGCMTCIGNSGPLSGEVSAAIKQGELVAAAVLSGNRNFEARINPLVKANYLASPPLVVAFALAGTVDVDFETEPLGRDAAGRSVFLREIWPSREEVAGVLRQALSPELFARRYESVFEGTPAWQALQVPGGESFEWDAASTYIQKPPYFENMPDAPPPMRDIRGARALAVLGDSITTDHISPAGSISPDSPAGRYLIDRGIQKKDFNSYGSRRGNHEVMIRGTFANVRIKNLMLPGTEGGWTLHLPDGEKMSIYDAAMRYQAEGAALAIIAGKEYGSGSSRDWAAKGTALLGVRAVIAESYERIHRGNLVGMGVLPLQFLAGENRETLGLTGRETFDLPGVAEIAPRGEIEVIAQMDGGAEKRFRALVRIDAPIELDYFRHGGILPMILRKLAPAKK